MSYRCKSGHHVWTDRDDALRCCNGFTRRFVHWQDADRPEVIRDHTYRPLTDPEFRGCGSVWHPIGDHDGAFVPERTPERHPGYVR